MKKKLTRVKIELVCLRTVTVIFGLVAVLFLLVGISAKEVGLIIAAVLVGGSVLAVWISCLRKSKEGNAHKQKKSKKPKQAEPPYTDIDIAYKVVKTRNGYKRILTTAEEREQMRREIRRKNPNLRIIESVPPGKKDDLRWIDEYEMFDAIFDDE